ncbi:hypothetical protein [Spiribacter insolitus]|uniref:Uncharacterized protein n=1 Tax=Spiribacter insolitus TaxID=3122417 RepID=A0ABV3T6M4_9GAMM
MGEVTVPGVHQVRFVYSALEDRLAIRLTMASGDGRVAWLTRRGLTGLMRHMNTMLKKSHPAADGDEAHDAVMALEHIGARSQVAAERAQEKDARAGDGSVGVEAPSNWAHHLITEVTVEPQGDRLVVALMGQPLPSVPDRRLDPLPVAGLSLTRAHAHELLHLMRTHAEQAGWALEPPITWMNRQGE